MHNIIENNMKIGEKQFYCNTISVAVKMLLVRNIYKCISHKRGQRQIYTYFSTRCNCMSKLHKYSFLIFFQERLLVMAIETLCLTLSTFDALNRARFSLCCRFTLGLTLPLAKPVLFNLGCLEVMIGPLTDMR